MDIELGIGRGNRMNRQFKRQRDAVMAKRAVAQPKRVRRQDLFLRTKGAFTVWC